MMSEKVFPVMMPQKVSCTTILEKVFPVTMNDAQN